MAFNCQHGCKRELDKGSAPFFEANCHRGKPLNYNCGVDHPGQKKKSYRLTFWKMHLCFSHHFYVGTLTHPSLLGCKPLECIDLDYWEGDIRFLPHLSHFFGKSGGLSLTLHPGLYIHHWLRFSCQSRPILDTRLCLACPVSVGWNVFEREGGIPIPMCERK